MFWTFAIVRPDWRGHGEAGMEKLFRRMKVLFNLVAFYLRRVQKDELVGPWCHDLDVKEKGKGPKPSASLRRKAKVPCLLPRQQAIASANV